ncbi:MAG: aminopeptidase P family N-terminal domain-containing protein, partial [Myxococcota bacterium]
MNDAHNMQKVVDEHALKLSADELRALLEGVISAPKGEHPERWMALVPGAQTAAHSDLQRLKDEVAEGSAWGFESQPAPASRLDALRQELAKRSVDGFLIPRGDEFHNEYPPRRADRLEWLTGFNGSAGLAAVLPDEAAVFVDGRYTLQASQQVDSERFVLRHLTESPIDQWILECAKPGQSLAVDPWLHTQAELAPVVRACEARGVKLVKLDSNPIDAIWDGQPAAPIAPLRVHPVERAGMGVAEKRRQIAELLAESGAQATVVTATDSVAWLTNCRGGDLPHTPAFLAAAILTEEGSLTVFVDPRKLTDEVRSHLEGVELRAISEFSEALGAIQADRVLLDEHMTPVAVIDRVRDAGATPVLARDPVMLPKARKNSAELKGSREAHRRDGAAVTRFLHWLGENASS